MKESDSGAAIAEILDFCFAGDPARRWFVKDPAFDAEVRARLVVPYQVAVAGDLDSWRATAEGCLALCMLLDQAPRNLFRDHARCYASDAQARAVTRHALARGLDRALPQVRRLFLYLPLEHSEDIADQELCLRLVGDLNEDPAWLDFAVLHRDIVARFGRFPHRNAVLGRASTPAELAFLTQPRSSF